MSVRERVLINTPILNEFVFDLVFNASETDKQSFTLRQRRQTATPKKTKAFATNSTIDQKLMLLSKLGVGYNIVFGKPKDISRRAIKELYKKMEGKSSDVITENLLSEGICVINDRTVTLFMNMLGNMCDTETYMINRDFHKVAYHVRDWKDFDHPTNEDLTETKESVYVISKMILNFAMMKKEFSGVGQLGEIDLCILNFLFSKRNACVKKTVIIDYFLGVYKKTIVNASLSRLFRSSKIDRSPTDPDDYSITSLGIESIMRVLKKITRDTVLF